MTILLALAFIVAPVTVTTSSCSGSSASAATSGGSGACSSQTQPCSPAASESNQFGKIGVQQIGPQKTVTWGVYPTDPYGTMTIQITIGAANVLGPYTRDYPQHGSFTTKSNPLASGDTFTIQGTWTPTGGDAEGFFFNCLLA